MSGIENLIQHSIERAGRAGQQGYNNRIDFGEGGNTGGSTINLAVNPDNVLQARKALLDEATRLTAVLDSVEDRLRMAPMGGDPASIDFARVVTDKLRENPDSYFHRCQQYVDNLEAGARALAETAREYGYTEDEITDSLQTAADALPGGPDA
ncbi:hypothetical protein [Actinoalloteichus sp. GBA129-24]|uniref:hypothetical protein n=1 Tax=Actinoalloteichus sp. GBA129-24 TaxID=1612551 RepID=UPI000950A454|nr:hypothetical protein [Actinoalloteichus sp. GBA129-24]APU18951.1 hypothetical protein UA75_04610 [Actinoalloteichus sp. GBA129-24]